MKKLFSSPILYFAIGGIALYFFLRKSSLKDKISLMFKKVKTGGTWLQPKLILDIGANNPTNQQATIKSFVADLYVNDRVLATFTSFGDQPILPNQQSNLSFTANPSILGAGNIIRELIQGKTKGLTGILKGNANIDGLTIPITQTISIL